jgi:Transglutaminase-like superfamily
MSPTSSALSSSSDKSPRRVLLFKGVHVCLSEYGGIFLDLNRNKYFGIGSAHVPCIHALFQGDMQEHDELSGLLDQLVTAGLLTLDPLRGHPFQPITLEATHGTLIEEWTDDRPSLRGHYWLSFLTAYARARVSLKLGVAHAVHRVKLRNERYAAVRLELDVARARGLIRIFRYLRPLLYAARERCLLDSMVLLEFLARYEIYPTWVFGVKVAPFEAHCWVQHGGYVFNGRPEHVRAYGPVMTA